MMEVLVSLVFRHEPWGSLNPGLVWGTREGHKWVGITYIYMEYISGGGYFTSRKGQYVLGDSDSDSE